LRDTAGNDSEYGRLLDQFLALPPSSQTKVGFVANNDWCSLTLGIFRHILDGRAWFNGEIELRGSVRSLPRRHCAQFSPGFQYVSCLLSMRASPTVFSAVAVPMGMSGGEIVTPPTATRDLLSALSTAEDFFWSCLELNVDLGEVPQVRDAAISLALIRAYQTALGAKTKNVSTVTAAVLGMSLCIALRRSSLVIV
jgi:hypothetical protein